MELRCAWCGKLIVPVRLPIDDQVSHGICLQCTEQLWSSARGRAVSSTSLTTYPPLGTQPTASGS